MNVVGNVGGLVPITVEKKIFVLYICEYVLPVKVDKIFTLLEQLQIAKHSNDIQGRSFRAGLVTNNRTKQAISMHGIFPTLILGSGGY